MEQAILAKAIRIKFRRHDGTIVEDAIRGFFNHEDLLEPYARNTITPGAVLVEHSWIPLSAIVEFVDEVGLSVEVQLRSEEASSEEPEEPQLVVVEVQSWTTFCRRTEDPKLRYIEHLLNERKIPHRRNGESWHAPILEVPEDFEAQAWELLDLVVDQDENGNDIRLDDIEDDDPLFDEFRSAD